MSKRTLFRRRDLRICSDLFFEEQIGKSMWVRTESRFSSRNDPEALKQVFDYMAGSLIKSLAIALWDSPPKSRIGFVELPGDQKNPAP